MRSVSGVSRLPESYISSDSDIEQTDNALCMNSDSDDEQLDSQSVKLDDWCLFEYYFDSRVFYVGQIVAIDGTKVTARFLQFVQKDRDTEHASFVEKSSGRTEEADLDQIVLKLDAPTLPSTTSRRKSAYIKFPFDFSSYDLGI